MTKIIIAFRAGLQRFSVGGRPELRFHPRPSVQPKSPIPPSSSRSTCAPRRRTIAPSTNCIDQLVKLRAEKRKSQIKFEPERWYVPGKSVTYCYPNNQDAALLWYHERAPGLSQRQVGLSKFIDITERLSIRFRADPFNVLNRAQFGAPNSDISQPNFATITR